MKSKSFKFITLPLLALMLLSIAFSAYKKYGGDWDWNTEKLLDYIPFFGSSQIQSKTKIVYYTPNAQPQSIYVGDGEWNFRIATTKGYYEVPKYGLTRARNTEVPATGKKCWDASILPYKEDRNYYGGILANSLPPNHSAIKSIKSDERGCVKIGLNLPEKIKEVKANKKVKLVFTSIS